MSNMFKKDIEAAVFAALERRCDCPFACAGVLLYWGNRIKDVAEKETTEFCKKTAPIPEIVWGKYD